MTVFQPERMLDYADLFVSTGAKPTFSKGQSLEDDDEKDPFDDMMDEAEQTKPALTGGQVPESIERTEKQPDHPLQQKGGAYQGYNNNRGYQNKNYQNANNNRQQHYRSTPATNFAVFDEDDDMDPEWGDFDTEKETGNFFGREIPEEIKLRNQLEEQRTRWGGAARKTNIDDEDEFDAMMEEEIGSKVEKKEIGRPMEREETPEVVEEESLEDAENVAAYSASKTLDEISEEVPQDIKDKIIDLEAEQQEKLRQTMLKDTFQPKTSAI